MRVTGQCCFGGINDSVLFLFQTEKIIVTCPNSFPFVTSYAFILSLKSFTFFFSLLYYFSVHRISLPHALSFLFINITHKLETPQTHR